MDPEQEDDKGNKKYTCSDFVKKDPIVDYRYNSRIHQFQLKVNVKSKENNNGFKTKWIGWSIVHPKTKTSNLFISFINKGNKNGLFTANTWDELIKNSTNAAVMNAALIDGTMPNGNLSTYKSIRIDINYAFNETSIKPNDSVVTYAGTYCNQTGIAIESILKLIWNGPIVPAFNYTEIADVAFKVNSGNRWTRKQPTERILIADKHFYQKVVDKGSKSYHDPKLYTKLNFIIYSKQQASTQKGPPEQPKPPAQLPPIPVDLLTSNKNNPFSDGINIRLPDLPTRSNNNKDNNHTDNKQLNRQDNTQLANNNKNNIFTKPLTDNKQLTDDNTDNIFTNPLTGNKQLANNNGYNRFTKTLTGNNYNSDNMNDNYDDDEDEDEDEYQYWKYQKSKRERFEKRKQKINRKRRRSTYDNDPYNYNYNQMNPMMMNPMMMMMNPMMMNKSNMNATIMNPMNSMMNPMNMMMNPMINAMNGMMNPMMMNQMQQFPPSKRIKLNQNNSNYINDPYIKDKADKDKDDIQNKNKNKNNPKKWESKVDHYIRYLDKIKEDPYTTNDELAELGIISNKDKSGAMLTMRKVCYHAQTTKKKFFESERNMTIGAWAKKKWSSYGIYKIRNEKGFVNIKDIGFTAKKDDLYYNDLKQKENKEKES